MMTRGSRSSRGGRRGGMDRIEQVSRALSRTLRHSAHEEKLNIREDGYVNVEELLNSRKYKDLQLDFLTLCQVVQENSKKRFKIIREVSDSASTPPLLSSVSAATSTEPSVSTDPKVKVSGVEDFLPDFDDDPNPDLSHYFIRANQGHSISIQDDLLLQPLDEQNVPNICVHGTYYSALTLILQSGGLKKMGRTHIHCAAGLPKASVHPETGEEIPAVLSGMRFDAEVLFYIDILKGVQDGLKFWRSDNGVILTTGREGEDCLPMDYVLRVEDVGGRAGGGELWTRDEGVIKEWPKTGKGKLPPKSSRNAQSNGGGRGGRGRSRPKVRVEDVLDDVSETLDNTKI
ncbi:hypothetical protein TWF106_006053 [Orbilia oligospora]|uniref:2'-phosphotransferase n=1 Tax=Orbilia oligospora TaxID=2813651 RepID=A0A7C8KJN3_ORBOL|nr:hypothetical protein TWF788_001591 [Orbilia oligospora]KAF3194626.1 hypothetical protein TWF106_006053 [Orbilia oligospora]KAF3196703.1 hypothetical protein TWF679_004540 [Orbilia oligospora]